MSGPLSNPFMFKSAAGAADFYDHQIANSCRYQDSANSHMYLSMGTATNVDKYTFSTWFKHCDWTNGEGFVFSIGSGTLENLRYVYSSGAAQFYGYVGDNSSYTFRTNGAFRDPSAWYHLVFTYDSTQSTAADRLKLYVNGVSQSFSDTGYTSMSQNQNSNSDQGSLYVNRQATWSSGTSNEAYFAETIFVDGTGYAASDFGETKNGVWIPKDPSGLSFGNNGFYLKYESSSDLGNDSSGNNNDLTVGAISAHDQMLDTPTFDSSSNGGNFCTMNPLNTGSNNTFSEGNLKVTNSSGGCSALGTMSLVTGHKWYFEGKVTGSGNNWIGIIEENGYTNSANTNTSIAGSSGFNNYLYGYNGSIYYGANSTATGATITTNDIIGVLVDLQSATNTIQFYKNGAAQGSAFNLTGTGINYTPMSDRGSSTGNGFWFNFGQEGTFGTGSGGGNSDVNGYGSFYYDDGAAAKAICTANLPIAAAIDPAQTDDNFPQKLFNPLLYTGDGGSSTAITGVGFQPDFVWIKRYNATENHNLYDSTRGVNKRIQSNRDVAETTEGLPAFGSDGFTVDASGGICNVSSQSYVAWNWRANGGGSSNSDGATSSTVQADPSGAFSIVTYTGISGSDGSSTVGHGMGVVPQLIFHKARNATGGWWTQNASTTNANYFLELNGTRAQTELAAGTYGAMSRPTTSVFSINGVDGVGGESRNYIAYCFANIEGYCKVGKYEGNGNADGSFIYTGFRPAFILYKNLDAAQSWVIIDNARNTFNVSSKGLFTEANNAESDSTVTYGLDILSNGFKMRGTNNVSNGSYTYIYLAMAHNPFKYATAR